MKWRGGRLGVCCVRLMGDGPDGVDAAAGNGDIDTEDGDDRGDAVSVEDKGDGVGVAEKAHPGQHFCCDLSVGSPVLRLFFIDVSYYRSSSVLNTR